MAYLDAKHGGIDDEVAALIKDCVGVRSLRVCNQVLLPRHATPKVDRFQVVQLRLPSLQVIGGCQRFVVCAPQLAALEPKDSYPPTPQAQRGLCIGRLSSKPPRKDQGRRSLTAPLPDVTSLAQPSQVQAKDPRPQGASIAPAVNALGCYCRLCLP